MSLRILFRNLLMGGVVWSGVATAAEAPFEGQRPTVELAILLDTSNSMDGLIDQARSQLWNIVQQFVAAKKAGQTPTLRVSVFEYGNTKLPATENYIRQVIGLTDDLDKVSEGLFGLQTQGGDEYCGAVIRESIRRLDWSEDSNGYKAIFIAGNEPFDQGPIEYRDACKRAIGQGIRVNTIHCGNRDQGVSGHWSEGAELAEGKFLNINQDEKVVHIATPQDRIIIELNTKLNRTYLWFGAQADRENYKTNQAVQDTNADSFGGLSSRAAIKSSSVYSNVGRDLIDTFHSDPEMISKLARDQYPVELQDLSAEQRIERIQAIAKQRADIQAELAAVNKKRQSFIDANQPPPPADATLGDAFAEAFEEQLEQSGFESPTEE